MSITVSSSAASLSDRARSLFATDLSAVRNLVLHERRTLLGAKARVRIQAAITALVVGFWGCGVASAANAKGLTAPATIAPVDTVERGTVVQAKDALDAQRTSADREIRRSGLRFERATSRSGSTATGGPLVEATSVEASADLAADTQFRSLFQSWKKLDRLEQGVIAIPSVQPVQHLIFTSNFGIRSDPFRGTAAMHAGVDIPGPIGTPIYATADGVVSHAGLQGGYGNLVEINHGKGIATRYGHLSRIMVGDNTRVMRGQLIGMMGSTGRSTGSHLHYEVRIDGHAVNPIPFLTTADYLLAAQDRAVTAIPVTTGPAPLD